MAFAMNFDYRNGNIHWMSTPGKRLRELRIEKKISQVDLAARVGIDQSTISDIENDRGLSAENMMRLCEALDTSPQYVMRGKMDEDAILSQIKALVAASTPVNLASKGKHLTAPDNTGQRINASAEVEPGMQPELTSGQRVGRGTPSVRVKLKPTSKQGSHKGP